MLNLKSSFWGYKKDSVEKYLEKLKEDYKAGEKEEKMQEIARLQEENIRLKEQIEGTISETEEINKKNFQTIKYFTNELMILEKATIENKEEVIRKKKETIQELQPKVDEIDDWDKKLKDWQNDLTYMKENISKMRE